ncbi:MAG: GNAT family N-acetyltransferase [Actinobacteria bacterium]|nr:GNAT family N-acetyltransferase [Actinomycetota bacterium]
MLVRRVVPADWLHLRALRLEALADTPLGFLETLAESEQLPDEAWQARASRGAEGGDSFQVLAWDGDRPVGTSVCYLRDGVAWLAAVYLAPAVRGAALLDELVERCAAWGRAQGMTALRLQVHEDNARARTAYARLGFADTGHRQPYDLDPTREELLLERPL